MKFILWNGISSGLDKDLVRDHDYKDPFYIIDIGENDVAAALSRFQYEQAVSKFPSFISEIEIAMWASIWLRVAYV